MGKWEEREMVGEIVFRVLEVVAAVLGAVAAAMCFDLARVESGGRRSRWLLVACLQLTAAGLFAATAITGRAVFAATTVAPLSVALVVLRRLRLREGN